ncbi:MAG: glycosyltransferase, partial [Clostridiaceae bacterium]|nr:glycosyltransferase [Clostridiaceae bacterium]
MAKVSVIVPVYNAEKTLERCLNSILGQTFSDTELVLVNDGSQDSSL